jgi:hypothetical protein
MSCTASAAWSRPISSPCYIEHGQCCGAVLSGHLTTVAMSRSGQLRLRCTIEPNCRGLSTRLAGASVTCDRPLDTCEPSCVPRAVRPFFIPVVHSPLGAVEYVAAPELFSWGGMDGATWQRRSPPRGGRARSHGTHGSARAHLSREARTGAEEHVAAPELNSARRQGSGPRDTWQHRSSPQQGGGLRGRGTRGVSGAHLCRELWSEATTCVTVRGCTPCYLS